LEIARAKLAKGSSSTLVREDMFDGMDKVGNFGASHAQMYAMPRVWIAAIEKRGCDALQLRSAIDFSRLLGPFHSLRHAGETLEPGLAGTASGAVAPFDLGAKRRRIHSRLLPGFPQSFGRFRKPLIPLPFLAGSRLEAVFAKIGDRPR
jgi:hypothetical protein